MAGYRKPFSQALYRAYDEPARDALVTYLEAKGHTIVNNEGVKLNSLPTTKLINVTDTKQ